MTRSPWGEVTIQAFWPSANGCARQSVCLQRVQSSASLWRTVGRFSKTLIAAFVAAAVSWKCREELLQFWSAPYVRQHGQAVLDFGLLNDAAVFSVMTQVTAASALLVTFPVFCAETWLLVCEKTARPDARRFTLPFALSSGAVALVASWLVRHIDFTVFYGFLSLCSLTSPPLGLKSGGEVTIASSCNMDNVDQVSDRVRPEPRTENSRSVSIRKLENRPTVLELRRGATLRRTREVLAVRDHVNAARVGTDGKVAVAVGGLQKG